MPRLPLASAPLAAAVALLAVLLVPVAAPHAGAADSGFGCTTPSGLAHDPAPSDDSRAQRLYDGYLTLPGFAEVRIGTDPAGIDWAMDPFRSDTWTKYFLSLRWLDSFTKWYQRRPANPEKQAWLARADAIARAFDAAHPPGGGPRPASAWSPMYAGQRAALLACLHALTPGPDEHWAGALRTRYGPWLARAEHAPVGWNQGLDPAIGLLAAGCVAGGTTAEGEGWMRTAVARIADLTVSTIDAQGAVNEQAVGYGNYLFDRFAEARDKILACGREVPADLDQRRALLSDFLAWATTPSGRLVQIGDTYPEPPKGEAGSAAQFAATQGAAGVAPLPLSAVYEAGYAFGRSTWQQVGAAAHYAFRFGPGRAFHGHNDRGQLTLSAYGEDLLTEGGHYGYDPGSYRDWLRSPYAHNVMTAPGLSYDHAAAASLVRQAQGPTWQFLEISDRGWYTRATGKRETRTRGLLASMDPLMPFAVVLDRMHRSSPGVLQQLWHLPADAQVELRGRSRAVATLPSGASLTLVQVPLTGELPRGALGQVRGASSPLQGWVSEAPRDRRPASTVLMSRPTRTASMLTLLVPAPAGISPAVDVVSRAGGGLVLSVRVGAAAQLVALTAGGSLLRL